MTKNRATNGAAANRGREGFISLCVILLLGAALLVLPAGCQSQASSAQVETEAQNGPETVPQEPETTDGVVAQPEMAEPVEISVVRVLNATDDAPALTLEKVEHDFGEIGPGTAHTAEFTFTNSGTSPLVVSQVRSCCGVVTKGIRNGQAYAPGESGTLEIEYQAALVPAEMERSLYLYTNDPEQGVVELTIRANIMRRVGFEPSSLKLFLKRDNAGAEDITLTSLDGRPFAIVDFRATADSITADFDPAVEATEFVLKPKADLDKLQANLRGQIRVSVTHPECQEVLILYDVLPEFTVTPPQLMMFNLEPGKPVRREVWILGNYQEDFEIESVTSQKGFVTVVETEKVTGAARDWLPTVEADRVVTRYQFVVDFTPPDQTGLTVVSDELQIKIKGGDTIPVRCQGFYAD